MKDDDRMRGLLRDLWWAIDSAWRDEEGWTIEEGRLWEHVLLSNGSIRSQIPGGMA